MDENLVGYLLDTLDADERRNVETFLRGHPDARRRLRRLKQMLQPLSADLDPIDPPPDMWIRTLARVAEYQCHQLPIAPLTRGARSPIASRAWWRRPDVVVAACLLMCFSLLIPSGVNHLRYYHHRAACMNNLRTFYVALSEYSERNNGCLPNVAEPPAPCNVAGIFVPILQECALLGDNVWVSCPTDGRRPPIALSLHEAQALNPIEFARYAPVLAGSYAYTLGYRDESGYHGVRLDANQPNNEHFPVMADQPPLTIFQGDPGNSPNHGGSGQNVLYLDGHCAYRTTRTVGVAGDDIYVNDDNQVAAGKSRWDAVLANSAAHP
jgi:prepilin-type processing-associated H-X9-DG protein